MTFEFNPLPGAQETFMSKQEVYHSSTLGPIPLSFTGRRLMQNLREEFQRLLSSAVEKTKRGQVGISSEWERVSEARGRIAQYMSELEKRPGNSIWNNPQAELANLRHENEVLRKANEAFKREEERRKRRTVVNVADPLIYFGTLKSRCIPAPMKNQYFVRVLEGNFKSNKRHQRLPGSIITTEMQIGGSMQVTALTSDMALDMAVEQAHKHGFTELTKADFEVRYLGPAEEV
jgi:hypothetical protein